MADVDTGTERRRSVHRWITEHRPPGTRNGPVLVGDLGGDLWSVLEAWDRTGAHSAQTRERMAEVAIRFMRRVTATGRTAWGEVDEDDCAGFIEARTTVGAPSTATLHFRRTTVRVLYRTLRELGAGVGDPTLDITLPPRSSTTTRPLTDDEITLLRTTATLTGRDRGRNAAVIALAEATAVTSEIPRVTAGDLDDPGDPRSVHLAGTHGQDLRWGPLTEWGRTRIAGRIEELGPDEHGDRPLTYSGAAGTGTVSAQASTCNTVGVLFEAAGLGAEPDLRPASIRAWAARSLHDGGASIEDVALALGSRSLDATARAIGLDWRTRS